MDLSLEDVRTALAATNVDQAKGTLNGPRQAFTIAANDQLLSADQYRPIVIAYRNGSPVRLFRYCNHMTDGIENTDASGLDGGMPDTNTAVILNIQRQPGANIISVVDRRLKRVVCRSAADLDCQPPCKSQS